MSATCRLLTTADAEGWKAALPTDACVLAGLEYVRIEERRLNQTAHLFVMECGGARVVYPFFIRPVPAHLLQTETLLWDVATPEYTGPILLSAEPGGELPLGLADFPQEFRRFCRSKSIISEFAHLGPWAPRPGLLDPACVEFNREIVYVDLTMDEKDIWQRSLSPDARRQTRLAIQADVFVHAAESTEDVLAFYRLHHETMMRRQARERGFISPEDFLRIYETMPDNAVFMLAELEGRVVAGGLYLQDATDVYWHLSAMDMDYARVRPVFAFNYEMILRSARSGRKRLVCGGGYQGNDGIFRFKTGFSPLRAQFQVYKRVHDAAAYAALTAAWSRGFNDAPAETCFFPAYRAGGPPPGLSNQLKPESPLAADFS